MLYSIMYYAYCAHVCKLEHIFCDFFWILFTLSSMHIVHIRVVFIFCLSYCILFCILFCMLCILYKMHILHILHILIHLGAFYYIFFCILYTSTRSKVLSWDVIEPVKARPRFFCKKSSASK